MTGTLKNYNSLADAERTELLDFWQRHARLLFQAPAWPLIFREVYNRRLFIFDVSEDGIRKGIIPLVKIRKNYTNLPFLDYTEPVCVQAADTDRVLAVLARSADSFDSGVVCRSCTVEKIDGWFCNRSNVALRMPLAGDEEAVWGGLSPKVRNQVRKPGKNGVTTIAGDDNLSGFYSVWSEHISRLGTPVHSLEFFDAVFKHFTAEQRILVTAYKDGRVVGGLILLFDEMAAYVPWASSIDSMKPLCINHALYWHAIRLAIERRKHSFDFLRSQQGSGTYRFKQQWGAEEVPLYYHSSRGSADPRGGSGSAFASAVWKRLPLAVSLRLGPYVRRFVA